MSLRNLFSSLAPIAVGAMFPVGLPALAAGAATGAAIAGARGDDVAMGAFTGGLGGYGGGQLGAGFRDVAAKQAVSGLQAPASNFDIGATMGGFNPPTTVGPLGATQGAVGTTTGSSFAQGSRGLGGLTEGIKGSIDKPTEFLKSMGGGDPLKGGIKTAALVGPGLAGAMVPDMNATTAEMNQYGYDPKRRLNLNMDTGLRLNTGGDVPTPEEIEEFRKLEEIRQFIRENDISERDDFRNLIMQERDEMSDRPMFSYQKGGYLETGMGDGVSDEIPASIDGEQPVLLSENEFVIPADVVSGIGNGSSDAGAEKLFDMMDRVRKARTGTKEMGKEITAERLMPA
tara:strand:- start:2424 stop:3452 length:1029 start_codon:yes stop_codon:yes gene_type:complete